MDLYIKEGKNKDAHTEYASETARGFRKLIESYWDNIIKLGVSPRELSHLLKSEITDLELETILDWRSK